MGGEGLANCNNPPSPGRSFAGSIPGAASMVGRLPAQLDYERRQLLDCGQLHPGQLRSFSISSPARPAPGMPKRPPASSRSTITAPGQLAGLLVAPRPMYGHAMSSQPANRCSTGQLHSIAGASFPGPPARLPGGQQLTRPASPGLDAGLVPHSRHRIGPGRAASPAPGPRPLGQLRGPCATHLARSTASRATASRSTGHTRSACRRPRLLDQLAGVLDQLPGSSGQQLPGPANRAASPGLDYGPG